MYTDYLEKLATIKESLVRHPYRTATGVAALGSAAGLGGGYYLGKRNAKKKALLAKEAGNVMDAAKLLKGEIVASAKAHPKTSLGLIGAGTLGASTAIGHRIGKKRNTKLSEEYDMNSYLEAELLAKEAEDAYSYGDYETGELLENAVYEKIAEGEALEYAEAADEAYDLGDYESGQILEQAAYEKLAEGRENIANKDVKRGLLGGAALGAAVGALKGFTESGGAPGKIKALNAAIGGLAGGIGGGAIGGGLGAGIGAARQYGLNSVTPKTAEDEAVEYAMAADEAYDLGDYESGEILEQAAYEKLAEGKASLIERATAHLARHPKAYVGGALGLGGAAGLGGGYLLGKRKRNAKLAEGKASLIERATAQIAKHPKAYLGGGIAAGGAAGLGSGYLLGKRRKNAKLAEDLDEQDLLLQQLLG